MKIAAYKGQILCRLQGGCVGVIKKSASKYRWIQMSNRGGGGPANMYVDV